jgi:hypothetical protein
MSFWFELALVAPQHQCGVLNGCKAHHAFTNLALQHEVLPQGSPRDLIAADSDEKKGTGISLSLVAP